MLRFPDRLDRGPTTVSERNPSDLQADMYGSLVRGPRAFHVGLQNARDWYHYGDDFAHFTAADWAITKNGTGGGTVALANLANGVLKLTTDATADDDDINFQCNNESVLFRAGYPVWFEAGVAVDDISLCALFVGLNVTDTAIMTGRQDSAGFFKADTTGNALVGFVSDKDAAATTVAAAATMEDGIFIDLAFGWDGVSILVPYVNGVKGTPVTTNINDDEPMAVSFAIQNDSVASRYMYIDYFDVWQLR